MRRDKKVIFFKRDADHIEMDSDGNFIRGNLEAWETVANVNHMGMERQQIEFGDVNENRFVVVILQSPPFEPNHVEIEGKPYIIERRLYLRHKSSFVVSES